MVHFTCYQKEEMESTSVASFEWTILMDKRSSEESVFDEWNREATWVKYLNKLMLCQQ